MLESPGFVLHGEPVRAGEMSTEHFSPSTSPLASDGLEKCIPCLVNLTVES